MGEPAVLVLTGSAGVLDRTVQQVCAFLGVKPAKSVRLGDRSVEVAISGRLPDRSALSECVACDAVDVNVVPAVRRRKSILIADMDSTIIPVECIDELADFAGVRSQVSEITERAMRGELNFEASLRARVALLQGLPVTALQQCYDERVSLNPGARTLVQTMNAHGAMTALISGGFDFFASRVAAEAGFEINQANRLLSEGGQLLSVVGEPILGRAAKLEVLHRLCKNAGQDASAVLAIGDGANDLAMIEAAGLGVAYRAKSPLRAGADAVLDHSDLTAVLALQGYREADYLP